MVCGLRLRANDPAHSNVHLRLEMQRNLSRSSITELVGAGKLSLTLAISDVNMANAVATQLLARYAACRQRRQFSGRLPLAG